MIRKILSGAAMVIVLAAPALAQDQCVAPAVPAIPDGAKAAPNQIVAAQNDIKAFAAASDNYQACLAQELGRQKDLAKQNNSEFDPKIQAALETNGQTQRADAGRLAAAWGAAVEAFNKAQQRKPQQPNTRSQPSMGGGGYGGGARY
jgi:hypothetical protein